MITETYIYGEWPSPITAARRGPQARRAVLPGRRRGQHLVAGDASGRRRAAGGDPQGPDGRRADLLPAAVERPDPGARVRRHRLPAARRTAGVVFANFADQRLYLMRETGTGPAVPDPLTPAPDDAQPTGSPTSCCPRPGTRCGACGSGTVKPGWRSRLGDRSWPFRWTARPRMMPARYGNWSPARISSPSRRSRRTAAGWPGSAGITRGCRGTAPNCGWPWPASRGGGGQGRRAGVGAGPGVAGRPACMWCRTGPAGGTCTRPAWAGRPRRCTRPRRSSPGRCGSWAAPVRAAGRRPARGLHGQGVRLGLLDPETGELTDLELPFEEFSMGCPPRGRRWPRWRAARRFRPAWSR